MLRTLVLSTLVPNADVSSRVKLHDTVLRTLSGNETITPLRTIANVSYTNELSSLLFQ